MESLRFVERNGLKFYCFIEVWQTFFSCSPKSTVRNWLKTLNIAVVNCSCEERTFFRNANPTLGLTFGLICHDDAIRLIEHRERKESSSPAKRMRIAESLSPNVTAANVTAANVTAANASTANLSAANVSVANVSVANANDSSPCKLVSYTLVSSDEEQTSASVSLGNVEEKQDVRPSETSAKRGNSIIPLDECPDSLKADVKRLQAFYTKPLNPLRSGSAFSTGTVDKLTERLLGFMYFCSKIKNITVPLDLLLFNDYNLYTSYVEYLRDVRKLQPSTIVNFLTAAINVVKFNISTHDPNADPNNSKQIKAYRAFQRDFQRESYRLSKLKKEGLCQSKSSRNFYFAHVLETLRNLRQKYFDSRGIEQARNLHDFVLLALYLRANPGRSKEMRTLRMYLEGDNEEHFDFSRFQSGNFIVFEPGCNVVYLIQADFKTAKSTGPTRVELTSDEELVYYLKLYVNARPKIMLGKSHDYFFVNKNGAPFLCSSGIAKYIGDIFEREVAIRASTNALRHALVTYFCSLEESADLNIRKSLAYLMKHSVRYQEQVYNDQSHEQKTEAGRNLLREKIAAGVFGDDDEVVRDAEVCGANGAQNEDDNLLDGEELELRPEAGDIVALLDGASTREDVHFFLAKVARYTKDRSEAHLIHLAALDDSDKLFVLKPGKVWKEPVNALIFPVDVIYNCSKNAYELRTSAKDIFECVHGSGNKP